MKSLNSFEVFKEFIDHQLRPRNREADAPAQPFVTLSRQAGAGGSIVSDLLLARFQRYGQAGTWTVFDKTLAEKVASDSALPRRIASYIREVNPGFIESTIEELLGLHPSIEVLARETARTIFNLAQIGHVIIVGRGGGWITARLPNGVHVRLVGSV